MTNRVLQDICRRNRRDLQIRGNKKAEYERNAQSFSLSVKCRHSWKRKCLRVQVCGCKCKSAARPYWTRSPLCNTHANHNQKITDYYYRLLATMNQNQLMSK